jgi:hypothetical protein
MKENIEKRLQRLEDLLRDKERPCMIALKTERGYEWNGTIYPDDESLSEAARQILGDYWEIPLVILARYSHVNS